jgi:hypothetical protein
VCQVSAEVMQALIIGSISGLSAVGFGEGVGVGTVVRDSLLAGVVLEIGDEEDKDPG